MVTPARVVAVGFAVVVSGCAALLGIEEGAVDDSVGGATASRSLSAEDLGRLRAGLVGYWRFEGNGSDSSDGGTHLVDSNGALAQGYAAGRIGTGWMPGLATDDRCQNCNTFEHTAPSQLQIGGDFTISVWVKPEASPSADGWFEYGIFDNDQVRVFGEAYNVSPSPCHPTMVVMKNGTTIASVRDPVFDFRSASNIGRWNHVVAFRSGTTLGIRVNDNLTTSSVSSASGQGTSEMLRVGWMDRGRSWQGGIDELGVWNRALETAEIDALYNHRLGNTLFP